MNCSFLQCSSQLSNYALCLFLFLSTLNTLFTFSSPLQNPPLLCECSIVIIFVFIQLSMTPLNTCLSFICPRRWHSHILLQVSSCNQCTVEWKSCDKQCLSPSLHVSLTPPPPPPFCRHAASSPQNTAYQGDYVHLQFISLFLFFDWCLCTVDVASCSV